MDEKSRLDLQEMIRTSDCKNTTDSIRKLRHSKRIRAGVHKLVELRKEKHELAERDPKNFKTLLTKKCPFLWTNYTNIFNRLARDELDVDVLYKFIDKLEAIEVGNLDQHTASAEVGEILKKLYIDSALRHQKRVDKDQASTTPPIRTAAKDVTWTQFKATYYTPTTSS